VAQLYKGRRSYGYVTPSWPSELLDERHAGCYSHSGLSLSHYPPVSCQVCGEVIEDGDEVAYIAEGTQPAPGYRAAERRRFRFMAHAGCWEYRPAGLWDPPLASPTIHDEIEELLRDVQRLLERHA
jgi:hypothetical protein